MKRGSWVAWALWGACGPALSAPPPPQPPIANAVPYTVKSPQGDRVDEYYWLRDDDPQAKRPEVLEYLNAERAYADAYMAPLQPLKVQLLAEMRARIDDTDTSVPAYDHGYWYWQRFEAGAQYPQYLRHAGTPAGPRPDAPDEVVLDVPQLAAGKSFYAVGAQAVSPDNRRLAFTEDTQGRRISTLRIRDLAAGRLLDDAVPGVLESLAWSADSGTVFYVRQDPQTLQSGPVYRHTVGTPAEQDVLVYDEPDKTLLTWIGTTASREFVTISIVGYDTAELRAVPTAHPEREPQVVLPRRAGVRSFGDHLHGRWVVRTNDEALNFRLVESATPADRASWKELVPAREAATLDNHVLFDNAIVLQERVDANARVRILRWGPRGANGASLDVPATEAAFTMTLEDGRDPHALQARYTYESMVAPQATYDLTLADGRPMLRKQSNVPTYDAARYRSARLWAPSRDGLRIPVSVVYRPDRVKLDGSAPLLVRGYGSYGLSTDAQFSSRTVSLLDRGFVVALAHVRGGAELGQAWYEDGRLLAKRNTFNDFVDATDFLVKKGYGARGKVFAEGGSAGGLLMGAVANQAGDRYRGIALAVPFVDVVTTMLDESIPLTANEWSQWGDPRLRGVYEYMLSYSPYDNIGRKRYPALWVSTGLWDSQVQYYEPAKYVARMRARKQGPEPVVFNINMEAGHHGKSGRFESLDEYAAEYSFFLHQIGIDR